MQSKSIFVLFDRNSSNFLTDYQPTRYGFIKFQILFFFKFCYVTITIYFQTMLGGTMVADEYFDFTFFHKFRSQSAVDAAIEFAHQNNWQFVAALFTYHGDETLPHWLEKHFCISELVLTLKERFVNDE